MTHSEEIIRPTSFNPDECRARNNLEVSGDNLVVTYKGPGLNSSDAASIRTNIPIDPRVGVYYFEVKIIHQGKDGFIGIGLSKTKDVLEKLPGWEDKSFGYHGDDGHFFNSCGTGRPYGPTFTTNDVIGCGVNFVSDSCFFTKNGVFLGDAVKGLPSPLYPTVGLRTEGEIIEANFGAKKYAYDVAKYEEDFRADMLSSIQKISLPPLYNNSLQKLVKSYLVYHGYSKAADAFAQSTGQSIKEELDSIKYRQEIRQLIMKGEISEAIRLTYRCYPHIFDDNPELLFKLKCREFVIMVVKLASRMEQHSLEAPPPPPPRSTRHSSEGLSRSASPNSAHIISASQLKLQQQQHHLDAAQPAPVPVGDEVGGRGLLPGLLAASGSKPAGPGLGDLHSPLLGGPGGTTGSDAVDLDVEMSEPSTNNANGHSVAGEDEGMDVCDAEANGSADQPPVTLESVIQYGRELNKMAETLKADSKLSPESSRLVMDAFSLLAYKDLKLCPVQHLVEPQSRESIAANVNSAILITQNLPVQPPLEVCIRQLQFCMNHLSHVRHLGDYAFASAKPLYELSICNELRKS